jgi:DsbC/DsbD-like thiol-disulfide interchange protein
MSSHFAKFAVACLLATSVAAFSQDTPFGRQPGSAQQWVALQEPPRVTIAPGKIAATTLHFQVTEGNHVNSNKPGSDLLIPTQLKLQPPPGITIGKITYPVGKDLRFDFDPDEKLNVYTGSFAVTVQLRAAANVRTGALPLQGELTYQACNDRACFPPRHLPVELEVNVAGQAKKGSPSR